MMKTLLQLRHLLKGVGQGTVVTGTSRLLLAGTYATTLTGIASRYAAAA